MPRASWAVLWAIEARLANQATWGNPPALRVRLNPTDYDALHDQMRLPNGCTLGKVLGVDVVLDPTKRAGVVHVHPDYRPTWSLQHPVGPVMPDGPALETLAAWAVTYAGWADTILDRTQPDIAWDAEGEVYRAWWFGRHREVSARTSEVPSTAWSDADDTEKAYGHLPHQARG